jgi:hypothetical protein
MIPPRNRTDLQKITTNRGRGNRGGKGTISSREHAIRERRRERDAPCRSLLGSLGEPGQALAVKLAVAALVLALTTALLWN